MTGQGDDLGVGLAQGGPRAPHWPHDYGMHSVRIPRPVTSGPGVKREQSGRRRRACPLRARLPTAPHLLHPSARPCTFRGRPLAAALRKRAQRRRVERRPALRPPYDPPRVLKAPPCEQQRKMTPERDSISPGAPAAAPPARYGRAPAPPGVAEPAPAPPGRRAISPAQPRVSPPAPRPAPLVIDAGAALGPAQPGPHPDAARGAPPHPAASLGAHGGARAAFARLLGARAGAAGAVDPPAGAPPPPPSY
jgi:hypothetical protein